MKIHYIAAGSILFLATAAFAVQPPGPPAARDSESPSAAAPWHEAPEPMAKKCSSDSDCPFGKCKSGQCGGCSFVSDCKGWGICKDGQCGACSFDSDCKAFDKCSGGKCAKSPY